MSEQTATAPPPRDRWRRVVETVQSAERSALVRAARSAALALPPVSRSPRAVRWAWVGLPAAGTAGYVAVVMRRSDEPVGDATVAGTAVAGGLLALATGATALWVDARLERALVRAGVPAPRVAIALLAGGSRIALSRLALRYRGPGQPERDRPR